MYGSSFPSVDLEKAKDCPYPWPKNIYPCKCKENESFQVFLICNIMNDVTENWLIKLQDQFRCRNEIYSIDFNLNGKKAWKANISAETLGKFEMTYFSLSNFTYVEGYIEAGAFSRSQNSLKGIKIDRIVNQEDSWEKWRENGVETGAFSNLHSLTSLTINNGFKDVRLGAFYNLASLTELTLSGHNKEIFENDTMTNIPNLKKLNLRNNKNMRNIGNLFENLETHNLVVDLSGNNIEELQENQYKIFLDNVIENGGEGYIYLMNNPMQCGCDTLWYLTSYHDHPNILRNTQCVWTTLTKHQENGSVEAKVHKVLIIFSNLCSFRYSILISTCWM